MTHAEMLEAIDEAIEHMKAKDLDLFERLVAARERIAIDLQLGEVWLHEYRQHVMAGQDVTSELREFSTVLKIARVTHAANKAWCEAHGDYSQTDWKDAPQWQKNSAVIGVIFKLRNPDATPSQQHDGWMQMKLAEGWAYGPVKDADAKTHPCLLPYNELPLEQRKKDALFGAIVLALKEGGALNVHDNLLRALGMEGGTAMNTSEMTNEQNKTAFEELLEIVEMDFNNGVEISMRVFYKMLKQAIEKEREQKPKMEGGEG